MTDDSAPDDAPSTPLRRLDTSAYDLAWAWQSPVGESIASFFNTVDNALGRAIARRLSISGARAVATRIADDWSNLASVEDGTIVSVVGRARATKAFSFRVADRPVIGLVLRFPMRDFENPEGAFKDRPHAQTYPPTNAQKMAALRWKVVKVDLEAAYDFELLGPADQRIPILVDGGRLLVNPTFPLRHVPEAPDILETIDLPAGADPTDVRGGFLWDGALVEVIGPTNSRSGTTGPALTVGDTDEPPTLIIPRGLPPARAA